MTTASKNQRRSNREQTFYTAYAYLLQHGEWFRHSVKIFDQSWSGVRLRSMVSLEADKLYVQLDPTAEILAHCRISRKHAVARNCWEFGLELTGLSEMSEVIPADLSDALADADRDSAHKEIAAAQTGSAMPGAASALVSEQLDELLNGELGLGDLPKTDSPAVAPSEEEGESVGTQAGVALSLDIETEDLSAPLVEVDAHAADLDLTATESEPEIASPAVTALTPVEPVSVEMPDVTDSAAEAEECGFAEPVSSRVERSQAYRQQPVLPVAEPPFVEEETTPEQPVERGPWLEVPELEPTRPSFVETVMVGFVGLAGLLLRGLMQTAKCLRFIIGASVLPGSFFSNKSEEEHRKEWLQACAATVNPGKTDDLRWNAPKGA